MKNFLWQVLYESMSVTLIFEFSPNCFYQPAFDAYFFYMRCEGEFQDASAILLPCTGFRGVFLCSLSLPRQERRGQEKPVCLHCRIGKVEVFDGSAAVNRRNINCWRCRYLFILTRPNFVLTLSGSRRSISGIEGKSPSFRPPRYKYSGSAQRSSKNPETCTPSPSASFSEVFKIYLRLSMNSRKPPLFPVSARMRLSIRDSSFRNSETCSLVSVSCLYQRNQGLKEVCGEFLISA